MLIAISAAAALAVGAGVIPSYPGAVEFCVQHVVGAPSGGTPGPEIAWTAHHTSDAPETVVAWYQRRLAAGLHRREGRTDTWRIPLEEPTAVLSVTAVADFALAASCDTRPPSTARAVIVMSTMTGRQPTAPPRAKAWLRTFPAAGITAVVLRAADADRASLATVPGLSSIEISGVPTGGAKGYHSPDPTWRETPAAKWGLDFVAERRGTVLIVSTRNEMHYIHHHYAFETLSVRVPKGVEVVTERRALTGDGAPDLH